MKIKQLENVEITKHQKSILGGANVKAAIMTIIIDRDTGERISKEIKEIRTVNEDEFYRPLVEILGNGFLKQFKKEVI